MKKLFLLSSLLGCSMFTVFALNHSTRIPEPKIEIITSEDGLKSYVVVDCGANGTYDYQCTCGSNCDACRAGAIAFINAGGCR